MGSNPATSTKSGCLNGHPAFLLRKMNMLKERIEEGEITVERLTSKDAQGYHLNEEGQAGLMQLVERLGKFEDFAFDILRAYEEGERTRQKLKESGRGNSYQARELLGQKMMLEYVLKQLSTYGLSLNKTEG